VRVSGQRHSPAALYSRETNWLGGWVGLRVVKDAEARRKFLCLCRASNPNNPVCNKMKSKVDKMASWILFHWLNFPGSTSYVCSLDPIICFHGQLKKRDWQLQPLPRLSTDKPRFVDEWRKGQRIPEMQFISSTRPIVHISLYNILVALTHRATPREAKFYTESSSAEIVILYIQNFTTRLHSKKYVIFHLFATCNFSNWERKKQTNKQKTNML
jgi:hypothetical protein